MKIRLGSKETRERLGDLVDAPLGVTIEPIRPRRSVPQNALLWPLCRALGEHVGLRAEEMYDEAASELFGYELVEWRGQVKKRPLKRPSKADREEFSQLIDLVQQWCAEEGVEIREAG